MRTVLHVLNEQGAEVNESTGLHVHVFLGDLDGPALADFVRLFCRRQRSLFDRLVDESRVDGRWAARITNTERDALVRYALADDRASFSRCLDRYVTMNTKWFYERGTVEFRQHEGAMNIKDILGWVGVLIGHVEAARRNVDITVPNGSDPEAFLSRMVEADLLAPALKAWALGDHTPDDLALIALEVRSQAASLFSRLLTVQGVNVNA